MKQQEARWLGHLRELVNMESPTGDGEGNLTVLKYLNTHLQQLGESSITGPPHSPVLMIGGSDSSYQLVVGHADTVWPRGTLNRRPFQIQDQKVYGPGVFDMKASFSNLILAIEALAHFDLKPSLPIGVVVNSDEETGSLDSRDAIRRRAEHARRVWVLEPSLGAHGALKITRRGVMRFQLHGQGKAAHSGMDPEKGINAILALSRLLVEIHALEEPGLNINLGLISGGVAANVVAPTAHATVEARTTTLAQMDKVARWLSDMCQGPGLPSFRYTMDVQIPPMETRADQLQLLEQVVHLGQQLGLSLEAGHSGGASDANTTCQVAPTIDGLGAVGDGAHASHEHVCIKASLSRAALLSLAFCLPSL
ncbi:MAG: M20/M25/M40 family metallo-hydrolase [Acidobacteria bacterium]|nr:M20/M25/M40 family metallo-hydrolase [Acidobacteriota bacterium]